MSRSLALCLSVLVALAACAPAGHVETRAEPVASSLPPSPSVSAIAIASAEPEPPKTPGGEPLVALEVEGHGAAALAVPVDAPGPRPIVLATHGNFDRPEWQCETWAEITRGRAFVLCPRGIQRKDTGPDDPRFTYTDNRELEREIDAATRALRASRYAPWLSDAAPIYTGFSLGAIMGVAIAERRPKDFPLLVLVEGGVERFMEGAAQSFAKGGGRRVLFVCAHAGCAGPARSRAARLEKLGVRAEVVDAGNFGHHYIGPVAKAVAGALPAFLREEGPRFAALSPK